MKAMEIEKGWVYLSQSKAARSGELEDQKHSLKLIEPLLPKILERVS